jgi:hypothetical protein
VDAVRLYIKHFILNSAKSKSGVMMLNHEKLLEPDEEKNEVQSDIVEEDRESLDIHYRHDEIQDARV